MICCRTPLHAAAFTDHVECLQLLLSHNAQVNAVDSSGKTPLMMAAENGQTNTVGKEKVLYIPALRFVNMGKVALYLTFLWIYFVKIMFSFCTNVSH